MDNAHLDKHSTETYVYTHVENRHARYSLLIHRNTANGFL